MKEKNVLEGIEQLRELVDLANSLPEVTFDNLTLDEVIQYLIVIKFVTEK